MIILGKEEEEEDDTLTGTLLSVDVATKENLENFVNMGEEFLKKPISRVNLAKLLSREKHLREAKSAVGNYSYYSKRDMIDK